LIALQQEQGDELLPGGGCIGLEEDAVAVEDVFAGGGEWVKIAITINHQVFIQGGEDEGHATGVVEQAVELLAATDGIGRGQLGPPGVGGELPEDAIQQEAIIKGDEAGLALEFGVEFLVQAVEHGMEELPVAVVEEGPLPASPKFSEFRGGDVIGVTPG